jgi:hypothetical protein
VACGVWSVECGVWSVECGVWSVECGAGSVAAQSAAAFFVRADLRTVPVKPKSPAELRVS